MIKEVAESTLKDVSAETSKLPDNVKLSSDVGESVKTGIESIGKRVDPETSCQGLFNQIHKKATKKVPEALSCS